MATEYKAYMIGASDHIVARVDIICADDETAKPRAKELVDGCAVELWQGARLLIRFEPLQ